MRGCLQFVFQFNRHMEHQDLISDWISNCRRSLEDAANELNGLATSHTLCDFPLLDLTYESLEEFVN